MNCYSGGRRVRREGQGPAEGAAEGGAPPVLSIALEYMGMVLDFPCLALEAQLIQKSVN